MKKNKDLNSKREGINLLNDEILDLPLSCFEYIPLTSAIQVKNFFIDYIHFLHFSHFFLNLLLPVAIQRKTPQNSTKRLVLIKNVNAHVAIFVIIVGKTKIPQLEKEITNNVLQPNKRKQWGLKEKILIFDNFFCLSNNYSRHEKGNFGGK